MKTLITLLFACCFGSAMAQSNLPACPSNVDVVWTNCYGTYTYADGGKYIGEFKYNLRNGQGTLTYASGDKYVGEFKYNLRHGQGTATSANGTKYVGEYKDGKRNGQGTYSFADGDKYVGEWKNGDRHGQGTYTRAKGYKYVGEWKNDKEHGQGTYTFASGDKYVGEHKDGKYNGRGIKFLANGKAYQSGIWKDNKLVQSKFIDVATFTRIPNLSNSASNLAQLRKTEEQPMAQSNLPECRGDRRAWTDCFGSVTYPDGSQYIGEFKGGKRDGRGTYTEVTGHWKGSKYIGQWREDKRHGEGIGFYGTNTTSGFWEDGRFAGSSKVAPVSSAEGQPLNAGGANDARFSELDRLRTEAEQAKRKQAELEAQLAAQQQTQIKPAAQIAPQGKRVALVIGNAKYKFSPLNNPVNDATDMAVRLRMV